MTAGDIVLGRNCRPGVSLEEELDFNLREGFSFLQLWYDEKGFSRTDRDGDDFHIYKNKPVIIHALINKGRYKEFTRRVLPIMEALGQKELIIHPVCHSEEITRATADKVIEEINHIEPAFTKKDITLFIENNGPKTLLFNHPAELERLFASNENLEFLLDLAHMNDYDHLDRLVKVKKPAKLHLADRHLEVLHEHLPLGKGDIDFKGIFTGPLKDFAGPVILELSHSDDELRDSRDRLLNLLA